MPSILAVCAFTAGFHTRSAIPMQQHSSASLKEYAAKHRIAWTWDEDSPAEQFLGAAQFLEESAHAAQVPVLQACEAT